MYKPLQMALCKYPKRPENILKEIEGL